MDTPTQTRVSDRQSRPDRRISRTRRSLREALFSLLLEKGYESITIEEITGRADVGRTTFYLHYRDKEDLLMCSVRELVEDLISQLASLPLDEWKAQHDPELAAEMLAPAITRAFAHVAQNADVYRVVLRGDSTYSATQRLRQILVDAVTTLIQLFSTRPGLEFSPQAPVEIFVHGLVGAWIGVVTWWLEQGLQYSPEQMAGFYHKMYMRSTREILGVRLQPGQAAQK